MPQVRLDRRDWLQLLLCWLLGCGASVLLLLVLLHTALEPWLLAESSLRISRSVVLVESFLQHSPVSALPEGVLVVRAADPGPEETDSGDDRLLLAIQRDMQRRFGLERSLQSDLPPLEDPSGGLWIRLRLADGGSPLWLYQPERLSSSSVWFLPILRSLTLLSGLLAGTALFLLLRVERPFLRVVRGLPDLSTPPIPLLPEEGIAPLRLLTVRINRLLERINSDAAGRRALLRGLAHDLAGPQTRMALRIEALLDQDRLEGTAAEAARAVDSDLEQLGRITEQLVLLADRGRPTLRFEEVALDDLCARLGASYPAGDLWITVPRLLVRLDVVGLERSLRNLIDNALDHGRPPVELSAWREGGDLLLQVDDHGRGLSTSTLLTMPPQTHSHDRQRVRHRGLGLAIVESFCRDHGGQLSLGTAPGGGLRARLLLRSIAANPLFVNF